MSALRRTYLEHMPTPQQQDLLARAHAGSKQARDELLLMLQPRLHSLAIRFLHQPIRWQEQFIEPMDLINTANVAMLRGFVFLRLEANPLAYLFKIAKTAMLECLNGKHSFIKTHSYQQPYSVISLDSYADEIDHLLADHLSLEAIYQSGTDPLPPKYVALYQAIEALPLKQREAILRRYGLYDNRPESANSIGRTFARRKEASQPVQHPRNLYYYHQQRALVALRQALTQSGLYSLSEEHDEQ